MSIGTAFGRWDADELDSLPPVFLACGPEEVLKDRFLEQLQEKFPSEQRDLVKLYADECSPEDFIREIRSQGLFKSEKWVVLKRLGRKQGGTARLSVFLEDVMEYIEDPEPETLLILEDRDHPYKKGRSLGELSRGIEEHGGEVIVFWEPFERELRQRIGELFREADVEVDPAALQLLLEKTRGQYGPARREATKLINGGGGSITLEDVREVVTREEASDALGALKDSLLTESPGEVLRLLRDLWREGKSPPQVLYVVVQFLRETGELRRLTRGGRSLKEALEELDLPTSKSARDTYQSGLGALTSRFPRDFHRRCFRTEQDARYRASPDLKRLAVERFVLDTVPKITRS